MTPIDDKGDQLQVSLHLSAGNRKCTRGRQVPGSNAFVPSVVGLIIAGEVVKDLIK